MPSGAQATATATVVIAPRPVTLVTATLPGAIAGERYSVPLVAVDGAAPLTWSVTVGALPPGLTLDPASGVLSGIPGFRVPSTYNFTLTVTDSWTPAQIALRAFTIVTTRSVS